MLLNADLGESWYDDRVGDDAGLMPHLDLCNVACGYHGGDVTTQATTIELALSHGVRIGAHPSYPDRKNFGRRQLPISAEEMHRHLLYQVGGLLGLARARDTTLHHLKPHGALYHAANGHAGLARAVAHATSLLGITTILGPPAGELRAACMDYQLRFLPEGFADRAYDTPLLLRPRTQKNALLADKQDVMSQVNLLKQGKVRLSNGAIKNLNVETLCIHGDHPGAAQLAAEIRNNCL